MMIRFPPLGAGPAQANISAILPLEREPGDAMRGAFCDMHEMSQK